VAGGISKQEASKMLSPPPDRALSRRAPVRAQPEESLNVASRSARTGSPVEEPAEESRIAVSSNVASSLAASLKRRSTDQAAAHPAGGAFG